MAIELTDLVRVKHFLKHDKNADDALLAQLITGASAAILTFLGVDSAEAKSRTEDLDVEMDGANQSFILRAFPVTSLTSVSFDPDLLFGSGTTLVANDDYALRSGGRTGVLTLKTSLSGPYPGALRVVYVAGFGATTDAVIAAFPDLAMAAEFQIASCQASISSSSDYDQEATREAKEKFEEFAGCVIVAGKEISHAMGADLDMCASESLECVGSR